MIEEIITLITSWFSFFDSWFV